MFMSPPTSTSAVRLENAGALLGLTGRRFTGRVIKVSLAGGVSWFVYQLINAVASSHSALQQSPAATIAFLALALTVAAFVAMRQQAETLGETQVESDGDPTEEMEATGLVSAIEEASDAVVITDGRELSSTSIPPTPG